ncbi:unnamed protein product [Larinioides sclopetarius]|uniref:Uncharacterized protein n=1 Tax=Larinioides sclopetarius TaxID=280406 RepID=A0AAV2AMU3_9ARAC
MIFIKVLALQRKALLQSKKNLHETKQDSPEPGCK